MAQVYSNLARLALSAPTRQRGIGLSGANLVAGGKPLGFQWTTCILIVTIALPAQLALFFFRRYDFANIFELLIVGPHLGVKIDQNLASRGQVFLSSEGNCAVLLTFVLGKRQYLMRNKAVCAELPQQFVQFPSVLLSSYQQMDRMSELHGLFRQTTGKLQRILKITVLERIEADFGRPHGDQAFCLRR